MFGLVPFKKSSGEGRRYFISSQILRYLLILVGMLCTLALMISFFRDDFLFLGSKNIEQEVLGIIIFVIICLLGSFKEKESFRKYAKDYVDNAISWITGKK